MDYHLSPDVHACNSGDLIIFLDLGKDRYFASPRRLLELDPCARSIRLQGEEGRCWTERLVAQGLVQGTAPAPREPLTSTAALILPRSVAFTSALLWAGQAVDRPFALRRALTALRRSREFSSLYHKKAATEAALFASWRPLWPRAFVCLHDTLALARYLSARGSACDVVFGVQGRPFAAHCWAEFEGAVLNDEPEYCSSFDVILRT